MANYGRLIGADEEGTLLRFKAHLRELIDPTIKEHHGRIVKTTGDGALVEFVSVVDAVRCAVKIQREMVERNADSPEDKRIEFRIGINVGEIIRRRRHLRRRCQLGCPPGGACKARWNLCFEASTRRCVWQSRLRFR